MDKHSSESTAATTIVVVLLAILGVGLLALLTCGVGGFFFAFTAMPMAPPMPSPSSVTYSVTYAESFEDYPMSVTDDAMAPGANPNSSADDRFSPAGDPFGPAGVVESAGREQAERTLGELRKQLDLYRVDVGSFPSTTQGLLALLDRPDDLPGEVAWGGPYTERIPADPWGQAYRYERDEADSFRVWSMGPDGIDGTADDIETRGSLSP